MKRGEIILLLVAISAYGVAGAKEAVLDAKGNQLKVNATYDVKFTKGTSSIWVTRVNVPEDRLEDLELLCPDRITMFSLLNLGGTSTIFLPAVKDTVVRVSTKLNIKFKNPTLCRSSGVWRVRNTTLTPKEIVPTGSLLSNSSMFTIEKFGNATYRFAFGKMYLDMYERVRGTFHLVLAKNSSYGVTFHPK